VSIIGNDFPAVHTVANAAAACAAGAVEVKANLTQDHEKLNAPGMTANPAEYSAAIISSSSLVTLMGGGLVRPLDDLIAAHGADIPKGQLITIDGKVMAVAFMANAQHMFYRKDLLEAAGVAAPKTYEELLAAAEAVRAALTSNDRPAVNVISGPTTLARLWRLGDDDHLLCLQVHHAMCDGWSTGVMMRELVLMYEARLEGNAVVCRSLGGDMVVRLEGTHIPESVGKCLQAPRWRTCVSVAWTRALLLIGARSL
jgi:hypothetical protein